MLKVADHSVETMTQGKIATIPVSKIIALFDEHPRIGRALWIDTLIDGPIYREWGMNAGRRTAKQRLAHPLCELTT